MASGQWSDKFGMRNAELSDCIKASGIRSPFTVRRLRETTFSKSELSDCIKASGTGHQASVRRSQLRVLDQKRHVC